MIHSLQSKKRVLRQLKISLGQLKHTMEMVRKKKYCLDIVHQTGAIRGAMKRVNGLIIRDYLENYVADLIASGKSAEATNEIMRIFKYG